MKICYQENWFNKGCWWNPRFLPLNRWFKLIKKLKDKRLVLKDVNPSLSGKCYQGSMIMIKLHHLHPYLCITLILMMKVSSLYPFELLQLLEKSLHLQWMKRKSIAHLSLRKLLLRDIALLTRWFQKKGILQVTILKKYLVPSLSTFTEDKLVEKGLGRWGRLMGLWRMSPPLFYERLATLKTSVASLTMP